ncbi:DUF2180 family protein [Streptomyces sp. 35M1]|uniref:DUF2180 family protein n=1 Tax=Streptomyces sp. 35M1 TaxID=3142978 RepID=UPI0039909A79
MNSYECRKEGRVAASAEAMCQRCGAGVCADHMRAETQELRQEGKPGLLPPVPGG